MIGILLLSTAMADITVTYTVPTHHIAGQPFTLDIQVLNDGDTAESIQNLRTDRWAIAFTVEQNAQVYTASSTKAPDDNVTMVTLQPRGLQELRLEVPNSAAWKTGTVQLQIQTPFSSSPHRQEILIHPHHIEQFAVQDVDANPFIQQNELLWTHQDALFVNPQHPRFIKALPPKSTFGTSLHLGVSRHIHWVSEQNIYVLPIVGDRTSPLLRTTIPWPNGEVIGPSFTDRSGRYMIPIWVGNRSNKGTLYMLILDRQGHLSFRKLFNGEKPEECIGALSQSGTPLMGIRSKRDTWILAITEVGNPQIDLLPPRIRALHREDNQSESIDLSFGISESQGLFLGLLSKTTPPISETPNSNPTTFTIRTFSIQGQKLDETPVPTIESSSNTSLLWMNDTPTISTLNDNGIQFWSLTEMIWSQTVIGQHAVQLNADGLFLWALKNGTISTTPIVNRDRTTTSP